MDELRATREDEQRSTRALEDARHGLQEQRAKQAAKGRKKAEFPIRNGHCRADSDRSDGGRKRLRTDGQQPESYF